jgi:hypothetical protein
VTPHSAWYTEEAMADLQRLLAEDVARVLAGQPARCPVSPASTLASRPIRHPDLAALGRPSEEMTHDHQS